DRTAWIYSQYRQHALSAYTEDEIQAAIWVIQQTDGPAGPPDPSEEPYFTNNVFPFLDATLQNNANALMTAAGNAVTGGFVNTNVRIVQLLFADGITEAQDLLIID